MARWKHPKVPARAALAVVSLAVPANGWLYLDYDDHGLPTAAQVFTPAPRPVFIESSSSSTGEPLEIRSEPYIRMRSLADFEET